MFLLDKKGLLSDKALAFADILRREKNLSTGMENGLAIPHAKSDSVDRLVVAFGIHPKGIDFESLDGKPAHFIFLVMSPRDTSGPHIQALARIARFLKDEQVREKLSNVKSDDEVFTIISEE